MIGDDIPSDRFALRCESVGIRWVCLPIRALSAGRVAGLGARPALSTDCQQPVDKAGRQLIGDDIPSGRFALRCESVGIRWVCLPIRALSAGCLDGLGARPALSTDCFCRRRPRRSRATSSYHGLLPKTSPCFRARRHNGRYRQGFSGSRSMAAFRPVPGRGSTSNPSSSCWTTAGMSPHLAATTGAPHRKASTRMSGRPFP